jgi:hypothetical protein
VECLLRGGCGRDLARGSAASEVLAPEGWRGANGRSELRKRLLVPGSADPCKRTNHAVHRIRNHHASRETWPVPGPSTKADLA